MKMRTLAVLLSIATVSGCCIDCKLCKCHAKKCDGGHCKACPTPPPIPPPTSPPPTPLPPTPPPPTPLPPTPPPPTPPPPTPPPPTPPPTPSTPPPTPPPSPPAPTPPPTLPPANCTGPVDCNAKECLDCSCVNKQCKCGSGWSGPNCQTAFCQDRAGCNSHGNCSMQAHSVSCECDDGWIGPKCETSVCTKKCNHGSVPNANCSACTACVGGWSGENCSLWNSQLSADQLSKLYTTHFEIVNDKIATQVKSTREMYVPLPGWLLVAAGINRLTDTPTVPFLDFTFAGGSKWTNGKGSHFGIPDQFQFNAGFTPALGPQPPRVLRTASDVVSAQASSLQKHKGVSGILGQGLSDTSTLYASSFGHDLSLTVYDSTVPVYQLEVKLSSARLSRFAAAALESLPIEYNPQTKPVFKLFFDLFGTQIPTKAIYGGLQETIRGWPTCLLKGSAPSPVQEGNCILDDSNMQSRAESKDYGGYDFIFKDTRTGGDPSQTGAAWVNSVTQNPILLSYDTESIAATKFVPEPLSKAFTAALAEYESEAVANAQALAASLQKKHASEDKLAYHSSVDGKSTACFAESLGPSSGTFPCLGALCGSYNYGYTVAVKGAEVTYTVTNPNKGGGSGAAVTCGCSVVEAEDTPVAVVSSSSATRVLTRPPPQQQQQQLSTNASLPIDCPSDSTIGEAYVKFGTVGGSIVCQPSPDSVDSGTACESACNRLRSCAGWTWMAKGEGKHDKDKGCTLLDKLPAVPYLNPGFTNICSGKTKPTKNPNVKFCRTCSKPANLADIIAAF